MSIRWGGETCHRYRDPASNGWVIQLTCGASNNINIYGEQPYCSPDNRHVIFNSDGYGAPHVFAAEIPPEFLASLGYLRAIRD